METEGQLLLASDELILIFTGFSVCILGYLIWFKQKISIIAGKKARNIRDKKGLCGFIGKWLFGIGSITMLLPLGIRLLDQYVLWFYTFFILLTALRIYFKIPYYFRKS